MDYIISTQRKKKERMDDELQEYVASLFLNKIILNYGVLIKHYITRNNELFICYSLETHDLNIANHLYNLWDRNWIILISFPTSKKILAQGPLQEDVICSICLSGIAHTQQFMIGDCFHTFHKKCIQRWFQEKQNCPFCTQKVQMGYCKVDLQLKFSKIDNIMKSGQLFPKFILSLCMGTEIEYFY